MTPGDINRCLRAAEHSSPPSGCATGRVYIHVDEVRDVRSRAFPQRNPASKGTRFLRCIQRSTRRKECTNTSSLAVLLQRRLRGWRYRVAVSFHVTCLDSGDIPQHTRTINYYINIYLLVHLCNLTHAHANVQESCARRRFP